ncbi:MAG: iron ABC transporter permease [Planctomycetes bacterium]|nr:iron ABC transporter permease [Planctomycetota bacterium]
MFVLAVGVGPKFIPPGKVLEALWNALGFGNLSAESGLHAYIVAHIRLPRAVMAVLVGGALAVSGAAMQGLFRNPLADPGLIGVSGGAALAATFAIVLGSSMFGPRFAAFGKFTLPVAAFGGALATSLIVYAIARRGGRTAMGTLLLAGVAIGALSGAAIGVLIYLADDQQLRTIQFWGLGSLGAASWDALALAGPLMVLSLFLIPRWSQKLNSLLLGEQEAVCLGTDVEGLKTRLMVVVAVAVGASVAMTGGIGFVGLVVPHLVRLMLGPDHRRLTPCSILLGGMLLLGADVAARSLHPPAEIPIGILTALLGAPFFLWLLLKRDTGGLYA